MLLGHLDYQITNLKHPHLGEDGGCVYDDLGWYVWIRENELCDEVKDAFGLNISPTENHEICKDLAYKLWYFFQNKRSLMGTFGTDYDRDIREIYKDEK